MNRMQYFRTWSLAALTAVAASCLLGACPTIPDNTQSQYDRGFDAGFLRDDWYWEGYFDSYDTVDFGPLYYEGGDIPFYETPAYDAGYWDGVWYAYNDGYFTDYRYAFILGFSEGYDNAFWPDYLNFLANDQHLEHLDGGWSDGYHDGFSEGLVFGANDFEQGLPFDWMDALLDYEDGVDLYFREVNVGTGANGPVILYKYGTDPGALKGSTSARPMRKGGAPAIRKSAAMKDADLDNRALYRPLSADARQVLNNTPDKSLRTPKVLRLTASWLNRVTAYTAATSKAETSMVRDRQIAP